MVTKGRGHAGIYFIDYERASYLELFFLLASFSSDSNVNAQRYGFSQLSIPFREMFAAYG